jgi:hypothetical protein
MLVCRSCSIGAWLPKEIDVLSIREKLGRRPLVVRDRVAGVNLFRAWHGYLKMVICSVGVRKE